MTRVGRVRESCGEHRNRFRRRCAMERQGGAEANAVAAVVRRDEVAEEGQFIPGLCGVPFRGV